MDNRRYQSRVPASDHAPEIEQVAGVDTGDVLRTLLEAG